MEKNLIVVPCEHPGTWIGRRCIICGDFKLSLTKKLKVPESDLSMLFEDDFDQEKWSKTLNKMTRKSRKK